MKNIFYIMILSSFVWSNIGYISESNGDTDIVRSTGTLKATTGLKIQVKDKIVTSDKSRVKIVLNDDTVITVGSDSVFVFDAYTFGKKEKSRAQMHIERGFFRSVTGKLGKLAPERFKVKTVLATIGIRGTDFSAQVSDIDELIKCYRGEISVEHKGEIFIVSEGEQLILKKNSSNTSMNTLCSPYAGTGLVYNRIYSTNASWFDEDTQTQDQAGSASVIAGCQFNQYLASETRITKTFSNRNYADMTTFSAFLKPQYPITDQVKVYGLLGFGNVNIKGFEGDDELGAHADTVGKTILSQTGFHWGVGVAYGINKNFSLFADYTSMAKDANINSTLYEYDPEIYHKLSVDGITVGMIYSF